MPECLRSRGPKASRFLDAAAETHWQDSPGRLAACRLALAIAERLPSAAYPPGLAHDLLARALDGVVRQRALFGGGLPRRRLRGAGGVHAAGGDRRGETSMAICSVMTDDSHTVTRLIPRRAGRVRLRAVDPKRSRMVRGWGESLLLPRPVPWGMT